MALNFLSGHITTHVCTRNGVKLVLLHPGVVGSDDRAKLRHLVAEIVTKIFDRDFQFVYCRVVCFHVLGDGGATVDAALNGFFGNYEQWWWWRCSRFFGTWLG